METLSSRARQFDAPDSPLHDLMRQRAARDGSNALIADFRLGYRYAMGSSAGQFILFYLVGIQYVKANLQDTFENTLKTVPEEVWLRAARPPSIHPNESDPDAHNEHVQRQGRQQLDHLRTVATNLDLVMHDMRTGRIDHYTDLLNQMAHYLVRKDTKFISGGRPWLQAAPPERRHQSFVQEYVMNGRPTGSPTYDVIYSDIGRQMLSSPPSTLGILAETWRYKSNEAQFYPGAYLEAADPVQIDDFNYTFIRDTFPRPSQIPYV